MLGLFGIFGRSLEIQQIDDALKAAGLNPRAVPEAVKLTTVRQLKEAAGGRRPEWPAYEEAAELLGYCLLGPQGFASLHPPPRTAAVEARLVAAIERGEGLDARLVILTLHAGLAHPGLIERYDLAAD